MTSLLSKIQTIFLASLCIITFSSLKAQNNEKIWTLKRCIEYAKVNNSELKQVELRYKLNQLQLKKAKLNQLPSANINTLQAIQFGKTVDPNTNSFLDISLLVNRFQFSGSMPLFNFYGLNNLIKSEEFNVQDAFLNIIILPENKTRVLVKKIPNLTITNEKANTPQIRTFLQGQSST